VQALVAAGAAGPENSDMVKRAVMFLLSQQNADGGFAYQKNDPTNNESDVNSTAYVAQAMAALGNTTVYEQAASFIASLQKPNGAFQWKKSEPDDNAGATYQAMPALLAANLVEPFAHVLPGAGTSNPTDIGMPRTGSPAEETGVPALAALALLLLGGGLAVRRRAAVS
jgi:MYXO-CTERM domain-containing protein